MKNRTFIREMVLLTWGANSQGWGYSLGSLGHPILLGIFFFNFGAIWPISRERDLKRLKNSRIPLGLSHINRSLG